jgi:tetratricopeptide (TPR) repeat protein
MEYFPLIIITLILLVSITRPFTVLFHELGHAIPAILLTKEKVVIYIGSYGDPVKSLKINIGLLEIWFRYNPFSWRLGLCVPKAKAISINRQIIYTLTGPFASFLIASIACYFTFSYDLHGAIKLILIIFLASSIFDLVINLIPQEIPIKLYDGTLTYNDGYSLKRLFHLRRLPKEYRQATDLYNQQKYKEAASIFKIMLTNGLKDEIIYQLAISSYLQIKNFKEAKEVTDNFISLGKMTSDDFSSAGLVYSRLGLHEKALEFYDKSLQENPDNKYSLNNKGYTLNLMSRYEEAIPFFDKAIEIETTFAYSYNNRGLSKIKMGKTEEGLADIKHSFELDKDNSYGFMNLGIYHFDKGEYYEALMLFKKAKELDDSTYLIDDLIAKAEIQQS